MYKDQFDYDNAQEPGLNELELSDEQLCHYVDKFEKEIKDDFHQNGNIAIGALGDFILLAAQGEQTSDMDNLIVSILTSAIDHPFNDRYTPFNRLVYEAIRWKAIKMAEDWIKGMQS